MTPDHLADLLPQGPLIVVCGRRDDAAQWRNLVGADRCLALPLDTAPLLPAHRLSGATAHLAWYHQLVAGLDSPGWLTAQVDAFDSRREATLLFPDPLDPAESGSRRRFGGRNPLMRMAESKTSNDWVWDAIGMARPHSIVSDPLDDLVQLTALVDEGAGVVCAVQRGDGSPSAGGDGIYWWSDGSQAAPDVDAQGTRIKLMPLLAGLPTRIHGLVAGGATIAFPPLELVAPARPHSGRFLCAGAVPTLANHKELLDLTSRAGDGLRRVLGYRGAFSIDGILTPSGFRPTDLNARLTSALEAAPCQIRVRLQMANLLAREGQELDADLVRRLANDAFTGQQTYTLYGATSRASDRPRHVLVRWQDEHLVVAHDDQAHGRLAVTPTLRGWLLTATLARQHLPAGPANRFAIQVFALSDTELGTDFGPLTVPKGVSTDLGTRSCSTRQVRPGTTS